MDGKRSRYRDEVGGREGGEGRERRRGWGWGYGEGRKEKVGDFF